MAGGTGTIATRAAALTAVAMRRIVGSTARTTADGQTAAGGRTNGDGAMIVDNGAMTVGNNGVMIVVIIRRGAMTVGTRHGATTVGIRRGVMTADIKHGAMTAGTIGATRRGMMIAGINNGAMTVDINNGAMTAAIITTAATTTTAGARETMATSAPPTCMRATMNGEAMAMSATGASMISTAHPATRTTTATAKATMATTAGERNTILARARQRTGRLKTAAMEGMMAARIMRHRLHQMPRRPPKRTPRSRQASPNNAAWRCIVFYSFLYNKVI